MNWILNVVRWLTGDFHIKILMLVFNHPFWSFAIVGVISFLLVQTHKQNNEFDGALIGMWVLYNVLGSIMLTMFPYVLIVLVVIIGFIGFYLILNFIYERIFG